MESSQEVIIEKTQDKKEHLPKLNPIEIEKLIVELGKSGQKMAKIGLILRDEYGIPKVKTIGKKIKKILDEHNVKYETEKDIINKKSEMIKVHIGKNKHDYKAKRALTKKLWQLHKLENLKSK